MVMTRSRRGAMWCAAMGLVVTLAGGCRQADGVAPTPEGEQVNKIEDIGRDLQNIANGDAAAPGELLDDLRGLDETSRPEAIVKALAASLGTALQGRALPDESARALAAELFAASTGRDLSRRQINRIGTRITEILQSTGAPDAAVEAAATAATDLAADVTENRRRWYHLF